MSELPRAHGSSPGHGAASQDADGNWRSADGQWLWTGSAWVANPQVSTASPLGQRPAAFNAGEWFGRHKVWTAIGVIVVIGAVGSAIGSSGNSSKEDAVSPSIAPQATSAPSVAPSPSPPSPTKRQSVVDRVRSALGSQISSDFAVGDSTVRDVSRGGNLLTIILATPSGGFQGPSTDDADGLTSVALAKTYLAGWTGATWVEFEGGLVSRATGEPAPNAEAFAYRIESGEAKQINWSNKDELFAIDWSLYRAFCQPSFKGCS